MDLTWFNYADSALKKYKVGTEYVVFGRPQVFNGRIQLVHPDMEEADKLELSAMGMQPYYNTSEKMKKSSLNSRAIEKLTKTLIDTLKEPIPEKSRRSSAPHPLSAECQTTGAGPPTPEVRGTIFRTAQYIKVRERPAP